MRLPFMYVMDASVSVNALKTTSNLSFFSVFLDFKKASGTVNHILLYRLSSFNFSTEAIMWFKSYLENRNQNIILEFHKDLF